MQKHEKDFVEKEMRLLTISHIGDQRTVGRVLKVPSNVDFLVNLMRWGRARARPLNT